MATGYGGNEPTDRDDAKAPLTISANRSLDTGKGGQAAGRSSRSGMARSASAQAPQRRGRRVLPTRRQALGRRQSRTSTNLKREAARVHARTSHLSGTVLARRARGSGAVHVSKTARKRAKTGHKRCALLGNRCGGAGRLHRSRIFGPLRRRADIAGVPRLAEDGVERPEVRGAIEQGVPLAASDRVAALRIRGARRGTREVAA